jgi:hypothetical protein
VIRLYIDRNKFCSEINVVMNYLPHYLDRDCLLKNAVLSRNEWHANIAANLQC